VSTAQAEEYIRMMQQGYSEQLVSNPWSRSKEHTNDGKADTHADEKLTRLTATFMQAADVNFAATLLSNTTRQELFTSCSMQIIKH
jgi:hypothetical protein